MAQRRSLLPKVLDSCQMGVNDKEKEAWREITRPIRSAKIHCSCFRRGAGVSQGKLLKKRK